MTSGPWGPAPLRLPCRREQSWAASVSGGRTVRWHALGPSCEACRGRPWMLMAAFKLPAQGWGCEVILPAEATSRTLGLQKPGGGSPRGQERSLQKGSCVLVTRRAGTLQGAHLPQSPGPAHMNSGGGREGSVSPPNTYPHGCWRPACWLYQPAGPIWEQGCPWSSGPESRAKGPVL